jgi:ribosomal 30S subunit maturation factor RimM
MVIETKDGSEMMIPFVLQFIEKIEPEKREISLKVGKDFFETEK